MEISKIIIQGVRSVMIPSTRNFSSKRLFLLRHGQAEHNPRAEAARHDGCSYDQFLQIMKEDDVLDAPLTALGVKQAKCVIKDELLASKLKSVDLIVSSPLSRALQTADIVCPPPHQPEKTKNGHNDEVNVNKNPLIVDADRICSKQNPIRICLNDFREINGWLLNAKRRNKAELKALFPSWDLGYIMSESDNDWTEKLESQADCGERGYKGLLWITRRKESNILVVCHGGLLRFLTVDHAKVKLVDGRKKDSCDEGKKRNIADRFENCEVREYVMSWEEEELGKPFRPTIILTEVN